MFPASITGIRWAEGRALWKGVDDRWEKLGKANMSMSYLLTHILSDS